MYSQEEEKRLRLEFWDRFENYSAVRRRQKGKPSKFMMNKTGIKQLKLKFHFDTTHALVGIDIETRNLDKRIELFGKLEELASILENSIGSSLTWELEHILPTGKSISRVSTIKSEVNIYNRECWPEVFPFLYKNMMKFESFFEEYRDFIR
jgi:hypothetical protein